MKSDRRLVGLEVLQVMVEETSRRGHDGRPRREDESDGRRMFANQMRHIWAK